MKLRKLEVWNYRAFEHATAEFPASGVLLIAGVNNSGKSALLSVLDAIARGASSPDDRHYKSADPPRATVMFELDNAEIDQLLTNCKYPPLKKNGAYREAGAFRELKFDFEARYEKFALRRVRAKWNGSDEVVLAGPPGLSSMRPGQTRHPVVRLLEGRQVDRDEISKPLDRGFFIPDFGADATRPISKSFRQWTSGLYHFTALRMGTAGYVYPSRADAALNPTGDNLPAVINDMYHNRKHLRRYERLKALIQEIVPGVGDLDVPMQEDKISLTFAEPAYPEFALNLKRLGTGVEQLLMTLAVMVSDQDFSMIIMEEPETNLHPGAQRALLALIHEWATDRPFVIATHSPVFLDAAANAQVLLVTRQNGTSEVRSLGNKSLEALTELGVRLSDVLSADRLLLVEGPSDEDILRAWFPVLMRNPRLVIIDGEGGENARYARRLQQWIDTADRLGNRRVLYLRDRDELPEQELAKLERGGIVKVGPGREIENYLLDPEALAAVLSERTAATVTPNEVTNLLAQIADGLKGTVVLKRVCRDIRAERLMDNKLRGQLGKRGAGLPELKAAVVARLKTAAELENEIDGLWTEAARFVDKDWPNQRLRLAPGEEILNELWRRYQLDGYSKKADGPAIATRMKSAPPELDQLLTDFVRGTSPA